MKKNLLLFSLLFSFWSFSQEIVEENVEVVLDTIVYEKSIAHAKKRAFESNLKEKYNSSKFRYFEEERKPQKEIKRQKAPAVDFSFFKGFMLFMKSIFPFILGAIVIFIILRLYLGSGSQFWNFSKVHKKVTEKLVYEDEDIHDTDLDSLLKKALQAKDTRLAVRYYYLLLLKKLSEKELIKYDKDKTNSEYLFELKNTETRKEFSYLSYIYTYVWYGEFMLDESDFAKAEEKYKSFFKTII